MFDFWQIQSSIALQISGLPVGHKKNAQSKDPELQANYKQKSESHTKNLVTYPKYSKYSYTESVKRDKKLADSA